MRRGFLGRCPSCGKKPLFRSYLKQVSACSNCSAEFARIRADDAAPWLTIIIVGHVFLPLISTATAAGLGYQSPSGFGISLRYNAGLTTVNRPSDATWNDVSLRNSSFSLDLFWTLFNNRRLSEDW